MAPYSVSSVTCVFPFLFLIGNVLIADRVASQPESGSVKEIREYVVTFPEYGVVNDVVYEKQLVLTTSSPSDVTINLAYTIFISPIDKLTLYRQSYVINSTSDFVYFVDLSSHSTWSNIPQPKTVTVTADGEVSVYAYDSYILANRRHVDAVLVRPSSLMGLHYVVLIHPTHLTSDKNTKFFSLITSTRDKTSVTIQLPPRLSTSIPDSTAILDSTSLIVTSVDAAAAGSSLTASTVLNKGQTVSLRHREDLTGVEITSDQPIVVTSGIITARLKRGWEHFWTQLPPVENWGLEFFVFTSPLWLHESLDEFHVIAAEDNTTVNVDCETNFTLPTALSWKSLTLNSHQFHHFLSDKPVMVIKVTSGVREYDSCMVALTDSGHWATNLTFGVPEKLMEGGTMTANYIFTIIIFTEERNKDSVTVNGHVNNITWNSVNVGQHRGSRTVVGGYLDVTNGMYVLNSVNGTDLMSAYVVASYKFLGMCFAVDGGTVQRNISEVSDTYYQCSSSVSVTATTTSQTLHTSTSETPPSLAITPTRSEYFSSTPVPTSPIEPSQTTTGSEYFSSTRVLSTVLEPSQTTAGSKYFSSTQVRSTLLEPSQTTAGSEYRYSSSTRVRSTLPESSQTTAEYNSVLSVAPSDQVSASFTATHVPVTTTITPTTAVTYPSTTTQSTTINPAQRIQTCHCAKTVPVAAILGSADEEEQKEMVEAMVETIRTNLTVPAKNVSAALRRKSSAPDNRESSSTMGAAAIACMSLVVLLVISLDIIRFALWVRQCFRNLKTVVQRDLTRSGSVQNDGT